MPKPDDHGSQGKAKKQKSHTIEKFLTKGWEEITLPAGEIATKEIPLDPAVEDLQVFGQQFDSAGIRLKKKLHLAVEETMAGAIIEVAEPAQQSVRILYKIVGEDEEDEEAPDLL